MPTLTDAVNTLVSNTTTLQTTVSGRITDMDGKISSANSAKIAAETAKAGAEVAKGLADTAKTDAITAQTLAENAKLAAETAQGVAATAKTDALTAKAATETAKGNAIAAQAVAENAKNLAQDWATKTTGAVDGGEYSAKYHATAASASASTAASTLADRYTKAETDAKVVELSPPATKAHIDGLGINAATLTGSLPAIDGSALTGITTGNYIKTHFHTTTNKTNPAVQSWGDVSGSKITVARGDTTSGNKSIVMYAVPSYNYPGDSGFGLRLLRSYDNSSWTELINPANGWGLGGYGGAAADLSTLTFVDTVNSTNSTIYYKLQATRWASADTVDIGTHSGYSKVITATVMEVKV